MARFCLAPATVRRAFFLIATALAFGGGVARAQPGRMAPPPLKQLGKLDPAEARTALQQLRSQGIAGDYYLEIEVRIMPRRGAERRVEGRLWGSRNDIGPLTRVRLAPEDNSGGPERRLLIQNGPESAVWRWNPETGVERLGLGGLLEPLIPETELTAFDLQMPFIYWDDFRYEGIARFRGRPAHVMVLRPPATFAARHPEISGVKVHLDTQFNALVQTELLGARGETLKTLSLVDLKKVGDQWIPKTLDIRDERTRDKTRIGVAAAALELRLPRPVFEPAMLTEPAAVPLAGQIERLE